MHESDERYEFASDNTAGIAPEAWSALERANVGCEPSYGDDRWTARARDLIRDVFECECEVFFTFNGTAANSLALSSLCRSYHSIISHQHAHVETAECGAPEFFSSGAKVLLAGGARGKLDPVQVERLAARQLGVHYPRARVVSITEPTELGTVYSIGELDGLRAVAERFGLHLHMDGARFANAVASLQVAPVEISWKRGVDVLSLGGTKIGMPMGEAVVFFKRDLAREFEFRRKQAGQLASKMRFLAASWVGMLEDGAWLRHAVHANDCARRLGREMKKFGDVKLACPVQSNAVFARLPEEMSRHLRDRGWRFHESIGDAGARFMCSWATRARDIDDLLADMRAAV